MAHEPDQHAPVTPEEFRALARVAGLTITGEREPIVLAELNAQLALARTLDTVLAGIEAPLFGPYDPAFPNTSRGGSPR